MISFDFPPNFQDTILACFIKYPEKFDRFGEVMKSNYFEGDMAISVARVAMDFRRKNGGVFPNWDTLELLATEEIKKASNGENTEGVLQYIEKLRKKSIRDVDFVSERVAEFARRRAVMQALSTSLDWLRGSKAVDENMYVKLFEEAVAVGRENNDDGITLDDYKTVVDKLTSQEFGIFTGFLGWDELWTKGWGPGWLISLLAPPKRFKSMMSMNLALNMLKQGADVIYYACEISQELSVARALYNLTGHPPEFMQKRKTEFVLDSYNAIKNFGSTLLVKEFASKTATIGDIKAHAKKVIRERGLRPRAIFIDYAETVKPADTKEKHYEQQANIFVDARAMGQELGCAIILPDRCNKESVDKITPDMTSFQGSFQKAGAVDIGIALCATDEELNRGELRTFVFLNRHGEGGAHFKGKVRPSVMQIEVGGKFSDQEEQDRLSAEDGKRVRNERSGPLKRKKGGSASRPSFEKLDEDED